MHGIQHNHIEAVKWTRHLALSKRQLEIGERKSHTPFKSEHGTSENVHSLRVRLTAHYLNGDYEKTTHLKARAARDPVEMLFSGFLRSACMLTPAMRPVQVGKKTPRTVKKLWPSENWGCRLLWKLVRFSPVIPPGVR